MDEHAKGTGRCQRNPRKDEGFRQVFPAGTDFNEMTTDAAEATGLRYGLLGARR